MPSSYYDKLQVAVNFYDRTLVPFRTRRTEMIRDYVGSDYSDYGADLPVFVNVYHQAADTYAQVLAASRPRALVTTKYPELKWFARHYQRALNNHIEEIRLEEELRLCVLDAYFCLGIMKVYYGADTALKLEGTDIWVDPGRPYAEHLSLDNFGFDTKAPTWRKITLAWDDYCVSKEALLADPAFADQRELIEKASHYERSFQDGGKRASSMTYPDTDEEAREFSPRLRLRDVWVPEKQRVVTMFAVPENYSALRNSQPLREVEWEGPESGPYRVLSLSDTPDNIIGVSPGMLLRNLSGLINSLYRKQVTQAKRQRDLPIYESGAEEDANRLRKAEDGRWTRVNSRDSVGVLKMGGVDAANAQFFETVLAMFDRMSGNLPAMAGLGPSADTLGQDQIIQGNVSKRQERMAQKVAEFTSDIMRDLGWLLWNDQQREIETEYQIPGTDIWTTSTWTPDHREGKFILYNFELEPYSLNYQSPNQRAQALMTYVNQIAVPLAEMLMQNGGTIDLKELTEMFAELTGLYQLKDVIKFQPAQTDQLQPKPQSPPRPGTTTRTHVRRNVSTGGTTQAQNVQSQQAFAQLAAAQAQAPQGVMSNG